MSAPGTTRARLVRDTMATALCSVTLDQRAGSADKLKHLKSSRRPENGAPERTLRTKYALLPHRHGEFTTSDLFVIELQGEIYYALGSEAEDRAADDAERYWWVLETLQSQNAGIQLPEPSWLGTEETTHNLIATLSLVVAYRIDAALLTN